MSRYRKIFNRIFASIFLVVLLSVNQQSFAADGEALFKANCAACHKVDKDFTGPALKGWKDRVPGGDWIYRWVANSAEVIASGDAYAVKLFNDHNKAQMTAFHNQLKKEDIDAILKYVDDWAPPVAAPTATGGETGTSNDSLIFGILTMVLALIAFVLLQVNSNLRKLSDEKEGVIRPEPVPVYKNKTYIMVAILVLFTVGGFYTINAAIGLGRQQDYQPQQPIFYSHKVHAGTNQISCLYCHGGAQDSKQASIPSVNVCMNCHKAIDKYEGPDELVRENGVKVDGTAEIQKLYAYAGWNSSTKSYNPDNDNDGMPDGSKPIEWIKIHNLPDHVYFNHSQHVKVGKQQCQTCHGNIQEMPEVHQFAPLSMGWCINCHRQTKVDFYDKDNGTGNKFYSIYEKFHNDLKNHKMDSVTVESIGGTECQKCHY
ncbi:MAG: c-type cytochrome [Ferruginibacter sp.]|nr:c-type cytochrome [Bacteroidota bacterium]MBX2918025.1 c-type cytochrome [Ferruginibacter sp.]MCB0708741.1 c-type cytochrome [Chitinophagaceae bacterium]MCC7378892.1 c-type cytochrome [Chitinophagaceae bacterium]